MAKFKFTKQQYEEALKPQIKDDGGEDAKLDINKDKGKADNSEKEKLKDKIEVIDSEYKNAPNRTYGDVVVPNVVEKTYEMPSSEETRKKVEDEISPLYDAKLNSLNSKNATEIQNAEEEKDELYQKAEESLKQLKKTYDSAKENTSHEAIKRGLARSSIILNQLSDLEQGRISATGGIITQRDKGIDALSREVEELKLRLLNDTNVLNEERAKEVNRRVEELLDKYQKEQEDVFEYNNKIRQQKAETLAKLKDAGIDVDETKSNEYVKMIADKTKAFYSYYYSLGEDALEELVKDRKYVEDNIGIKGYETLKRYFE